MEFDNEFLYPNDTTFFSNEVSDFLSSPNGSDSNSSPIQPPAIVRQDFSLQVLLTHKPRGSKGVWQEVNRGEKLRVTKGKGKRLKLDIKMPEKFTYDPNRIRLALIDLDSSPPAIFMDGFSIEAMKESGGSIQTEVKLLTVCKNLQFIVYILNRENHSISGKSCEFFTHNSGTPGPSFSKFPTPKIAEIHADWTKKRKVNEIEVENEKTDSAVSVSGDLHVAGFVRAKSYIQYSDIRLKTNITDLVDAMQIVTSLQGKTYNWKNDPEYIGEMGSKRTIGLIAQEVQKVLPDVVREDPETGYLSVSYNELLPVIVEAFKEFLKEYKGDKQEFRSELDELRQRFEQVSITQIQTTDMQEHLKKLAYFLKDQNSQLVVEEYKSSKSSGFLSSCKISTLIFSIIFVLSLILVIIGLILLLTNTPRA